MHCTLLRRPHVSVKQPFGVCPSISMCVPSFFPTVLSAYLTSLLSEGRHRCLCTDTAVRCTVDWSGRSRVRRGWRCQRKPSLRTCQSLSVWRTEQSGRSRSLNQHIHSSIVAMVNISIDEKSSRKKHLKRWKMSKRLERDKNGVHIECRHRLFSV